MSTITHKRGDTFSVAVEWTDPDTERDLTGVTCAAQLNKSDGELIQELTCTLAEIDDGYVKFDVTATAEQTRDWPIGTAQTDAELTLDGEVWSSPTFIVRVLRDETVPLP